MVMNIYILFLISLPEAVLNAIIILLISDKKAKLKLNKNDIARFLIAVAAMLTASFIIRPMVKNVIQSVILHSFVYILIFTVIYSLKLADAVLSTFLTVLFISTISNIYYPFIIAYISHGIENFSKNYHLFVVYSIPTRIFQIIIIYILCKYEVVLITKISRRLHRMFIILTGVLVTIEYGYAYMFYINFFSQTLQYQICNGIILLLLVAVVNFIVFSTIYIEASDFLIKGYKRYNELEEDAKYALNEVKELLENNKNDEAIYLIKRLNGEI